ncbi:hypothetical protein M0R45_024581 [Rubus argutus]|uniref:Uncharacterized protein n=1 Tax=Rubus argutus TaxID=59490 RepID=A0AAW1WRZ4_RUBAR
MNQPDEPARKLAALSANNPETAGREKLLERFWIASWISTTKLDDDVDHAFSDWVYSKAIEITLSLLTPPPSSPPRQHRNGQTRVSFGSRSTDLQALFCILPHFNSPVKFVSCNFVDYFNGVESAVSLLILVEKLISLVRASPRAFL